MAKKLLSITVRGKRKTWDFNFYADPRFIPEWEADGLEIYTVENVIPVRVVDAGMLRPWCFLQDIFNLKNPFRVKQ